MVSCSIDDEDDVKLPEVSLVAKANLDFVDEGETIDLNCYRKDSYGEILMHGYTLLILRLYDTDLQGNRNENVVMTMSLESKTGFEERETFEISANHGSDESIFSIMKVIPDGADIYMLSSVAHANESHDNSGSVTITSLSSDRVEGTFSFTAHNMTASPKKVEVINGVFHGDLHRW